MNLLIADLSAAKFQIREAASKRLAALAQQAEQKLQMVIKGKGDIEAIRRGEILLKREMDQRISDYVKSLKLTPDKESFILAFLYGNG